mgnify:CR=1 FL=1
MADAHDELHQLAAQPAHDDSEAVGADEQQDSTEEKLVKLDQRLTKRINDLRKDFDTTRKATSKSVADFQQKVTDLTTEAENNMASMESLRSAVELAESNATKAAHAADRAHAESARAELAAFQKDTETRIARTQGSIAELRTSFEGHTHDVQITLTGETQPPKGNPPGRSS